MKRSPVFYLPKENSIYEYKDSSGLIIELSKESFIKLIKTTPLKENKSK